MRTLSRMVRGAACVATLFLLSSPLRALSPADEPLVKVVEKCRPAVVNINTDRIVQRQVQDPFDRFFGNYDRSYVIRQRVGSLGSGVLIDPAGYIVTCAHVVGRAEDKSAIRVTLSDGTIVPAKLLASDEDADLALLKIESKNPLPFLSLAPADLSPDLLGQTVVALGNPVGLQSSVSAGILSAKDRKAKTDAGEASGLIQTDAAINPGNSGGALVDIEGKLVGVCNAKLGGLVQGTNTAVEGIGFAIPAPVAAPWVADAIAVAKGEKAAPAVVSLVDVIWKRFGVRFQNITPDLASAFQLPSANGMLVAAVQKGGPAEAAGMANGMVLVRLGNVNITSSDSLPRELGKVKPGDAVTFTLAVVEQRGSLLVRNMHTVELQAR